MVLDPNEILVPDSTLFTKWIQERFGLREDRYILEGSKLTLVAREAATLTLTLGLTKKDLEDWNIAMGYGNGETT